MFTTWEGLWSRVVSIEFSLVTKFEEKLQEEKGEGKMSKKERERLDTTINVKKKNNKQ